MSTVKPSIKQYADWYYIGVGAVATLATSRTRLFRLSLYPLFCVYCLLNALRNVA